jgi:hypothetical protein
MTLLFQSYVCDVCDPPKHAVQKLTTSSSYIFDLGRSTQRNEFDVVEWLKVDGWVKKDIDIRKIVPRDHKMHTVINFDTAYKLLLISDLVIHIEVAGINILKSRWRIPNLSIPIVPPSRWIDTAVFELAEPTELPMGVRSPNEWPVGIVGNICFMKEFNF